MRRSLLSAGLAMTLAFSFASNARADAVIGQPAPAFKLQDQTGKQVSLSDYAGKVVVIEWFNEECPFVKKHYTTGAMNALATKYAAKEVVWLAINSTYTADVKHNAATAAKLSMDRKILDDHAGVAGHAYAATNTPQMFIVDQSGKLVYKGAIDNMATADPADLENSKNFVSTALDQLLANKPITQSETKPYGCTVKYGK